MGLSSLLKSFPEEDSLSTSPRPYFNHAIELKKVFSAEERAEVLDRVGLNIFFFPSEMITGCDLLSDSGTNAMANEQWAALHVGDEAYGSGRGYFILMERIRERFGKEFFTDSGTTKPNAFIFHQGRPSEDALFTVIGKLGSDLLIPGNGHFDTTAANMEANKIHPVNLFSPDLQDPDSKSHFKGNMDVERLEELLKTSKDKIPIVYMTITNNTGGGQPVSMENIRAVSEIVHGADLPLFFDACRFAENAWFIKEYEKGYGNKSIEEIILEMFTHVDGFTISFKKDGLVNMGGGLFLRENGLFVKKYPDAPQAIMDFQITTEGHSTYGGLSGRDIMAAAVGLGIVTNHKYLSYRINQIREFGEQMDKDGIPIITPTGGHAVYMDINKFFEGTNMKPDEFGGIAFTALLLAGYGHRACELGYFAFGSYDKKAGKEIHPEVNFVRFAIPRLRYEKQDLDYVAECTKVLYENREKIPGVKVTHGQELTMRHFKAKFAFKA